MDQVTAEVLPEDVSRSIQLALNARGKIKQNLFWVAIYNIIAIPVAAGARYPALGFCYVRSGPRWQSAPRP